MKVLAPIDGSECSIRALRMAARIVDRFDGDLDVVHFVDQAADREREETRRLLERAEEVLEEVGVSAKPEVQTDVWITDYRYANRVGKDVLREAQDGDHDMVVMGHHGTGAVGRMLLGSAAETVVRAAEVPVTVVP